MLGTYHPNLKGVPSNTLPASLQANRPRPAGTPALLLVLLLAVAARPAWAASPETDVGAEEQRLRRPKQLEVPERAVIPVELPPEGELPSIPEATPPISVSNILFEGATLLPEHVARRLTAGMEGREVTLQELRQAAQGATRWYRGAGYVTSRAVVPAQQVEQGVVRVRVIEGKVGVVRFEGNKHFRTELLERYVKLAPAEVLQMKKLEKALGLLNSHPDRKVKAVLAPSAEPEATDIVLQVSDKRPLHASGSVDTLGTKQTGLVRQSVILSHGNLTGADDQILVRGIISEFGGVRGGAMSYLRPLNHSGLSATLNVSGVKSSVGEDLKGLKARGRAFTVSPGLVIPVIQRSKWEIEAAAGFDYRWVRTFLDEVSSSKDDLRVVHLGTHFLGEDSWGRSFISQEVRHGIPNVLGGSHPEDTAAGRAGAGGSFTTWNLNAARVQQGPFGLSLLMRGSGQITTDRLVAAEQMRMGGFDTVRGYPEGEYLADAGYQATVELRAPLERFTPPLWGHNSMPNRLRRSLVMVGFWDFAEGFLRDPRAGEDADTRLAGVGCGFRLRPTAESVLQTDFGWAIGDADSEKDRPRVHLICRVGF